MAENRDPVGERLEDMAGASDESALPTTPDEATSAAGTAHPSSRKVRLIAVASAVVLVVGAMAWSLGDDDDETAVFTPGPSSSEPETPTTTAPTTTILEDLDWDSLPEMGIAVQRLDGPLHVYDLDGVELGVASAPPDTVNGPRLFAWPHEFGEDLDDIAEVPLGCASAEGGGGLRIALCGDPEEPRRIDVVDSAGRTSALIDGLPAPEGSGPPVLGHWRWAIPSPDGRWVLAQWSGECEVPTAFVIEVATGELRSVDGWAGAAWGAAAESTGLGWSPDGRAVVTLGPGACGVAAEEPGTYLLDPATGALRLVVPAGERSEPVFVWRARAHGNELEWLLGTALRSLGLDGCCGEPSHGGSGVTGGAVYEGRDIGIGGHASDGASPPPEASSHQRVPLLEGEAIVLTAPEGDAFGQPIVGFTCGRFTWWLSWWDEGRAEVDSMLLLAEELVPHLACTLGVPPGPD